MARSVARTAPEVVEEDDRKETKGEKFCRIAERRTNEIVDRLRILGNLWNPNNYEYTGEQVALVFDEIEDAVHEAKARFAPRKRPVFRLVKS